METASTGGKGKNAAKKGKDAAKKAGDLLKKAKNIKSLAPIVSALSAIRNCFTYYIFNNRIYRVFCNFARFGHGESYRSM